MPKRFFGLVLLYVILINFPHSTSQCDPPRSAPLFFFPDAPTPVSLVQMHLFETELGIRQAYVPKFLIGAPLARIMEFKRLLESLATLRDDQIVSKFNGWMQAQSAEIKAKYNEYDKASNDTIPLFTGLREQKIAEYSPKTFAKDSHLVSTISNPFLTASDKIKHVIGILHAMSDSECDEIGTVWRQIRIEYAKIIVAKANKPKRKF